MKARILLIPLLPLVYLLMRASVVARVRRYETIDADAADVPGVRLYLRGRRIHLTIDGNGPPLLMLHGFGTSGFAFRRLTRLLQQHLTMIVPDLPGWGYSERWPQADHSHPANAALMLSLLERLGVGRVILLGHGTGATVAIHIARAAPDRVAGLVLAGSPNRGLSLPTWLRPLLTMTMPLLIESRWGQRRLIRPVLAGGQCPDADMVAAGLHEARVVGHAATLIAMLTNRRDGPTPDIRAFGIPALVIPEDEQPEEAASALLHFVGRIANAGGAEIAIGEISRRVQTGAIG